MVVNPATLNRISCALLVAGGLVGCLVSSRRAAPTPAARAWEAAHAPSGFVYVPGGECWVGTNDPDADDDVKPARQVFVPSFYIGRTEVTHTEWKRFRPDHRIPAGREQFPVTKVTLEDARAYCAFVGGYLPTDTEWEKAARGEDGRRYPWGDRLEPGRCNIRDGAGTPRAPGTPVTPNCSVRTRIKAVDVCPTGASPYGALNMAGNAWEWVSDPYHGDPRLRIIRGGAAGYWERDARAYHRAIEGAGVT
ncbi:MAG: Serine/threonine protein kinase [Armatimonadetes bacterium]|jgi:formylglycine-generating enzyme required for sulfatase activity|nr:Serine/threonine protein kinase [Armatimonadota bacterium]